MKVPWIEVVVAGLGTESEPPTQMTIDEDFFVLEE